MLNRPSPRKVALLSFFTLGLYFLYWCSRSRADIQRSAKAELIPSTWLMVIPAANFWWMWRYAQALDHVSYGRLKFGDTFLLYILAADAWMILGVNHFFQFTGRQPTTHATVVQIIVFAGLFVIVELIGVAAFAGIIQRKINAITPASSLQS